MSASQLGGADVTLLAMNGVDVEALAARLVALAQGQTSLAAEVGISAEDQAEILQFAIARMRIGKNAEAARVIEGLVALDDENPIFHEYLGLARERMSDWEAALTAYDAHVERLARLAKRTGEQKLAVRLTEGYMLRARAHARRGDLSRAREDLAHAARHDRGVDPAVSQERVALERALGGIG